MEKQVGTAAYFDVATPQAARLRPSDRAVPLMGGAC